MSSAVSSPESGNFSLLAQNGPGNNWNPQGTYQIVSGITAGTLYTFSSYFLQDSSSGNTGTYNTPVALQLAFGNFVGGVWTVVGTSTTWVLDQHLRVKFQPWIHGIKEVFRPRHLLVRLMHKSISSSWIMVKRQLINCILTMPPWWRLRNLPRSPWPD